MHSDAFGFLLLSGPLCGITMVLGGILLLYKGAITLNNSSEDALSVEFRKELRISTQYPALGIFVIGLLFVTFSVFMGQPPEVQPVTIKAKTVAIEEPVSIRLYASSWNSNRSYKGKIMETHRPSLDTLYVEIVAPGHEPKTIPVLWSTVKNGEIDLGDIELAQTFTRNNLQNNIAPLPGNMALPDINAAAAFGEVQ